MSKRTTNTKPERVEMVDAHGNIARPYPDEVPAWVEAGWTLVQPKEAGKAED